MFLSLICYALAAYVLIFTPLLRNLFVSRMRLVAHHLLRLDSVGPFRIMTDTVPNTAPPPQNLLVDNNRAASSDAAKTAAAAADGDAETGEAASASKRASIKKADLFYPAGTTVRFTCVRHGESVGNVVASAKESGVSLALLRSLVPALVVEADMMLTQLHDGAFSDWPLSPLGEQQAVQLRTQIEAGSIRGFPDFMRDDASPPSSPASPSSPAMPTAAAASANSKLASSAEQAQEHSPRKGRAERDATPTQRRARSDSAARAAKRAEQRAEREKRISESKDRVVIVSSTLRRAIRTMQLALHPQRNAWMTGGALIDSALQETCPHFDHLNPLSHRYNPTGLLANLVNGESWRPREDGLNLPAFNRYRSYRAGAVAALDGAGRRLYGDESLWRRMDSFVASVFARPSAADLLPYAAMIGESGSKKQGSGHQRSRSGSMRAGAGEDPLAMSGSIGAAGGDDKPITHLILVGHGSWLRRFFARYLPAGDDIVDAKERELARTLREQGLSNTATVVFDFRLGNDGVPRILPSSVQLQRGELSELQRNLVSPAVATSAASGGTSSSFSGRAAASPVAPAPRPMQK